MQKNVMLFVVIGLCYLVVGNGWWPSWWHPLAAWSLQQDAEQWRQRLQLARSWAVVMGQPVQIMGVADEGVNHRFHGCSMVMRIPGQASAAVCWRRLRHYCGSTWPDERIVFTPTGETMGRQGRWWFGSPQMCCWQVVLTHTGRLRLAFVRDTLDQQRCVNSGSILLGS